MNLDKLEKIDGYLWGAASLLASVGLIAAGRWIIAIPFAVLGVLMFVLQKSKQAR